MAGEHQTDVRRNSQSYPLSVDQLLDVRRRHLPRQQHPLSGHAQRLFLGVQLLSRVREVRDQLVAPDARHGYAPFGIVPCNDTTAAAVVSQISNRHGSAPSRCGLYFVIAVSANMIA